MPKTKAKKTGMGMGKGMGMGMLAPLRLSVSPDFGNFSSCLCFIIMLKSRGMSIVLGIESTCDETAASIVVDGKKILSNVIYSQTKLHQNFGGVFPELACRAHLDVILPVVEEALAVAKMKPSDIDLIAVANQPGLMGALLIGMNTAKSLAFAWGKPFVGVNHIKAHLYAALMSAECPEFPALGLVLSGGHTSLVLMHDIENYSLIGNTVDDALGEAFDKVARLLALPYPGGPEIEKLASMGDCTKYPFTPGLVKGQKYNFSFSGLKTQVLYALKGQNGAQSTINLLPDEEKKHIAAAFQNTAFRDILAKCKMAILEFGVKQLFIGGGVSSNQAMRALFQENLPSQIALYWPGKGLSLDNAAMIAGLGFHVYQRKGCSDLLDLIPSPTNKILSI